MTKNNLKPQYEAWSKFNKQSESAFDSILKSIKIYDENDQVAGYLVPFSTHHVNNAELINKLTTWRNEYSFAYPTQFVANEESTRNWLCQQVLGNDSRTLFWLADANLVFIGHLGVVMKKKCLELDNVLKASPDHPGLMSFAVLRLEKLLEEEFTVENLQLRVLKSNSHAVDFYSKIGYEEVGRENLIRIENENGSSLVPGEPAVDQFISMGKSLTNLDSVPSLILTAGPSISTLETSLVFNATEKGWNGHHSDYINLFEKEFSELVGSKFAMATSSCSGALHLSLLSLGIGPGDEVIVPELTWVATASSVRYVGAKPVFADVNKNDWTISTDSIRSLINGKTKAIIPVHLYGFGANMTEISKIAEEYNLFLIEDAAPAIGTRIETKKAGTFGDFGCYSFQGAKLLVTGEGGMLVTDNEDLYMKAKKIQDHGRKVGTFWIEELGYKYKMNNITAALGLAQIRRSANQIERKRRVNSWYKEEFADCDWVSFQEESSNTESIFWMTSIVIDDTKGISRDSVIAKLKSYGIDSRPVFPAISQYPIWPDELKPKAIAKHIGENGINLPSGVHLTRNSVTKVATTIKAIVTPNE